MEDQLEDAAEISALTTEIEQYMEEAAEQEEDAILPATNSCTHPGFITNLCIKCGELVFNASDTLPFEFQAKNLTLRKEEIIRLCNVDFVDIMRQKKLHLILDLDNTLLHSTNLEWLIPLEKYFKESMCPTDDVSGSSLYIVHMKKSRRKLVKLRPYVRTFLEEASKYYCLSIATYGTRGYALAMAKILDPSGCYFGTRIVCRDDLTREMLNRKRKRLDAVLGHKNVVLILDDKGEVWRAHIKNLILISSYDFFYEKPVVSGSTIVPLLGRKFDEVEEEGALANVLKVLEQVHRRFFDPSRVDSFATRDVRMELPWAVVETRVPSCFGRIMGLVKPFILAPLIKDKIIWRNKERWRKICRLKIGLHIKIFVWRAICGALPTKRLLAKYKIGDKLCAICGLKKETALHLFFQCKIAKMVWFNKWNIDSTSYNFRSTYEWFDAVCSPHRRKWCNKEKKDEFAIFAFTLAYKIWVVRNHLKYQGRMPPPDPSSCTFTLSLGCVLNPDDLPLLFL